MRGDNRGHLVSDPHNKRYNRVKKQLKGDTNYV